MTHRAGHELTTEMDQCIADCTDCHRVCLSTVRHCLGRGGKHAAPAHIAILEDCAEICRASANSMIRGSELHTRLCAACADICSRCAESCEAMDGDEVMAGCAEVCRRCAESCERMAAA